ncbi:MAG: SH3 domain-containing protein [Candidatus Ventricola sp.]
MEVENGTDITMEEETVGAAENAALYIGRVDTRSGALNVRRTPGGSVMGSVARGESVRVIGEEGEWLAIEYEDGVGYVSKRFVSWERSAQRAARLVIEDEEGNTFLPKGGFTVRLSDGPID